MSDNLEHQLDEVTSYINKYWSFQSKLLACRNTPAIAHFVLVNGWRFQKSQEYDLVTGKLAEINTALYAAMATEEQKKTVYFQAFTSDYPIDAISSDVESKFPTSNFKKLKKLHDIKKTEQLNFNWKQYLGIVLGGSTLVLKTVPKKVAEYTLGIPYEDFEVWVFLISMAILVYLLMLFSAEWYDHLKANKKHMFIGKVLEYIALKKE